MDSSLRVAHMGVVHDLGNGQSEGERLETSGQRYKVGEVPSHWEVRPLFLVAHAAHVDNSSQLYC